MLDEAKWRIGGTKVMKFTQSFRICGSTYVKDTFLFLLKLFFFPDLKPICMTLGSHTTISLLFTDVTSAPHV